MFIACGGGGGPSSQHDYENAAQHPFGVVRAALDGAAEVDGDRELYRGCCAQGPTVYCLLLAGIISWSLPVGAPTDCPSHNRPNNKRTLSETASMPF